MKSETAARAPWRRALMIALATAVAVSPAAGDEGERSAQGRQESPAQEHLRKGVEFLQNNQQEKGIEELEKAIEAEPRWAIPYYYIGMANGALATAGAPSRYEDAYAAFVKAAELQPGFGEAHMNACRVAYQLKKFDESWEHAIMASQAGIDMADAFAGLQQVAEPPDDWQARLQAPRVFLGGMDTSGLTGRESSLFGGRQAERGIEDMRADERGTPATEPFTDVGGPPFAGRFDPAAGTGLAAELQAELHEVRRRFGEELQRSGGFGIVPRLEIADFVLVLIVDDVGEEVPRPLRGFVKLFDYETEEEIYSRPLELRNISSVSDLRNDVARYVGYMEQWLGEQGRQ